MVKDGRLIEDAAFGQPSEPIFATSVAKSFCALAALTLRSTHQLSLAQTMDRFVPEWKSDARGTITVYDALAMTTGLEDPFATTFTNDEDTETVLRASKLVAPPTRSWRYNNNAINLVNLAVHALTGIDVDYYLQDTLFTPLGITNYDWYRDAYHHAACASGLSITATDLASVGQLLLTDGVYRGRRILPPKTYARLATPSQPFRADYSLGWWIIRRGSLPFAQTAIAKGPVIAIEALGSQGQFLYVSQSEHLVVVRLIDRTRWRDKRDSFDDFESDVEALTAPVVHARGNRV